MPFCSSLINHNPKLYDLFDIINPDNREHELLANFIKRNTENNNKLYTSIDELKSFEDLDTLITKYNNKLYYNP